MQCAASYVDRRPQVLERFGSGPDAGSQGAVHRTHADTGGFRSRPVDPADYVNS